MNKLVTVLGVAAVATLAGCKDPNYKPMSSQTDVKTVAPAHCKCPPGTLHEVPCACGADDCLCQVVVKPIVVKPVEPPTCKCAPGTKHTSPCLCNAPDCKCVVEVKPLPPAPAEETTIYVVQSGDYLAKISKKYNVTINSIKRLNNLTSDTVRVGQKLKLPGKLDIVQTPAETKPAPKAAAKKVYTPYTGATKEYVVKSGDTLGAVAYGNGCNIRQLKELNGLTTDVLKVGQKLKVPAEGKPAAKPVEVQKINEPQSKAGPAQTPAPEAPVVNETPATPPVVDTPAAPAPAEPPAPAADAATTTYVVQEGDDMTGVSIRFCVSAAAIRELNNLPEDAQLTPGQIIKLPAEAQQ